MPANQTVSVKVTVDNPRPQLTANLTPPVIAIFLLVGIVCLFFIFRRRRSGPKKPPSSSSG